MRTRVRVLLGLFYFFWVVGCAARDPATVAAALDRARKTGVHAWLVAHDPSKLDVAESEAAVDALVPLVPDGTVRAVSSDVGTACAAARRDRALLLIYSADSRRRDAALDCGFAVYRDAVALVIAPS